MVTAFVIIFLCLLISLASLAQNITLQEKEVPLEKIFKQIEKQSGYVFFFNDEWMSLAKPVTVDLKDIPLTKALDECFKGQPLQYALVNKTIVVKQEEIKKKELAEIEKPQVENRGRVVDTTGMPLPGAPRWVKTANPVTQ